MELTKGQIRYRKYKKSYDLYRKSHIRIYGYFSSKYNSINRFDGKREMVLERDGYKCIECGMTNEEHIKRWKRSITVDHIDGKGRNSPMQNNSMDNLQTLCLSCHGKKDIKRTRSYDELPLESRFKKLLNLKNVQNLVRL